MRFSIATKGTGKTRLVIWCLAAMAATAAAIVISMTGHHVRVHPDTASYLYFDPSRTIGYPAFLWVVTAVTGQTLSAVTLQTLVLAASIFLLALSYYRLTGEAISALCFEAALLASPQMWKFSAALVTEALGTAFVALFCAQLLRILRDPTVRGIALLVLASGCAAIIKPSLAPLFVGAAMATLLLTARRDRLMAIGLIGLGLGVTLAATPVANLFIHGSAESASPLARGVLQHTLFCSQDAQSGDPDARFVEAQAAPIRAYVDRAPRRTRELLKELYSAKLRFGLIIPELGRHHGLNAGWQTDPIVARVAMERVLGNPRCYAASVITSYTSLATFKTYGHDEVSELRNFLEESPLVEVPSSRPLATDEASARRIAMELDARQAPPAGTRLYKPPSGKPFLLIMGARALHGAVALLGLIALLALVAGQAREEPFRQVLTTLAVLGAVYHGVFALTAVSEFPLLRYTVPMWPVICTTLAVAASAVRARVGKGNPLPFGHAVRGV